MIRYFAQGRFGPWYEIEAQQWRDLGLSLIADPDNFTMDIFKLDGAGVESLLNCVVINTATTWKDSVKKFFPGLQDLIWFPDMRCGECGGRLIDELAAEPDKRYPRYVHATGMLERHGAWPVERWDD